MTRYFCTARSPRPSSLAVLPRLTPTATSARVSTSLKSLDVWELGLKTKLRNRSIRWNSAVFFYDYTDQQVPFQFFDPNTTLLQTSVVNAGKTEVKGFETDIVWRSAFIDGLTASLGYTFTDAEFTDFNLAEILDPGWWTVKPVQSRQGGQRRRRLHGSRRHR